MCQPQCSSYQAPQHAHMSRLCLCISLRAHLAEAWANHPRQPRWAGLPKETHSHYTQPRWTKDYKSALEVWRIWRPPTSVFSQALATLGRLKDWKTVASASALLTCTWEPKEIAPQIWKELVCLQSGSGCQGKPVLGVQGQTLQSSMNWMCPSSSGWEFDSSPVVTPFLRPFVKDWTRMSLRATDH